MPASDRSTSQWLQSITIYYANTLNFHFNWATHFRLGSICPKVTLHLGAPSAFRLLLCYTVALISPMLHMCSLRFSLRFSAMARMTARSHRNSVQALHHRHMTPSESNVSRQNVVRLFILEEHNSRSSQDHSTSGDVVIAFAPIRFVQFSTTKFVQQQKICKDQSPVTRLRQAFTGGSPKYNRNVSHTIVQRLVPSLTHWVSILRHLSESFSILRHPLVS